ncbi:hypothetical protein HanPSC8_Chr02g0072081 [Helianthus annuus]|nr:hypothetical protein HanPSC8_Chr02g0072081 [Helianthus annuus]
MTIFLEMPRFATSSTTPFWFLVGITIIPIQLSLIILKLVELSSFLIIFNHFELTLKFNIDQTKRKYTDQTHFKLIENDFQTTL